MLLWWMASAVAAPCGEPVAVERIAEKLAGAEAAYRGLDADGFAAALDSVYLSLECVAAPLSPSQSAQLHRLTAIRQFTLGRNDEMAASVTAARALQPDVVLDDALVPVGHPVREAFDLAQPGGASEAWPPPAVGQLVVDGAVGAPRYADRAHVLQVFDGSEEPVTGAYVFPGEAPPAYARAPMTNPVDPKPPTALPKAPPAAGTPPRRWPVLVGVASTALIVGGVATYVSTENVVDPDQPPRSYGEAWDQYLATRSRVVGGTAMMAAGGVGLGALTVRWGLK